MGTAEERWTEPEGNDQIGQRWNLLKTLDPSLQRVNRIIIHARNLRGCEMIGTHYLWTVLVLISLRK